MSEFHKTVTVYLVRHGESTSNMQFKVIIDSVISFLQFRGFSWSNLKIFLSTLWFLLFDYEPNSHLSKLGMQQVTVKCGHNKLCEVNISSRLEVRANSSETNWRRHSGSDRYMHIANLFEQN